MDSSSSRLSHVCNNRSHALTHRFTSFANSWPFFGPSRSEKERKAGAARVFLGQFIPGRPRLSLYIKLWLTLFALQGVGVTHDAPDQAVVIRVGGRFKALFQALIKLVLIRTWEARFWNSNPQSPQPRRSDEDEQRKIGHSSLNEIGQALLDNLFTRQPVFTAG